MEGCSRIVDVAEECMPSLYLQDIVDVSSWSVLMKKT